MRHVWSLIAGIVVALAGWLALAVVGGVFAKTDVSNQDKYVAVAIIVVTGLLFGAVGSLRNSPLGALVVSLAYFGLSLGPLLDAYSAPNLGDWAIGDYSVNWEAPTLVLAVVAATLFMAIFSPSRWRGNVPVADPNVWNPPPAPSPWNPPSNLPPDSSPSVEPPTEKLL
jgi:hypothetical protein